MNEHEKSNAVLDRYAAAMMNTFGRPRLTLVRGQGSYVWDADGHRYLDLLGGIAVNSLGHAHPAMVAAIADQAATLMHTSNFFATPWQVELGERLGRLVAAGADVATRVFFTNSGTEANEAAFKATRRTGRIRLISTLGSFHGRTMGALALTATEKYRKPFEPLPGEVIFVEYGEAEALAAALDDTVAAVVVEPIQGENGVIVPPRGYLTAVRELTRRHGALMWVDEIQTGVGRTGEWFAHQTEGVLPDLVTVAKGIGAGYPMGACVAVGAAADLLAPGDHGTTFGGNPLAARVGLTVLDILEGQGILAHTREVGDWLAGAIEALGDARISHVRGRGLLRGIVLTGENSAAVAASAQDAGFIVNAPRPDALRLAPPLIVTRDELATFVDALPAILDGAGA
jgi:acetylornithine/N-succinyldiaminopimelate aminotransferase